MDDPTLIMWTPSQIAERDQVSKQAISKTLKRMLEVNPETPVERGSAGQVLRVSLAHYDHFRQRFTNPAKAAAPVRSSAAVNITGRLALDPPPFRVEDSFDEARRQSEWLKVGREKIRHQEECSQLVRVDKVNQAHKLIGAEMNAMLRRLPNRADDVALAVSKEGVHGVRVLLREIAFQMGTALADRLDQIATDAPENDPLIDDGT